MKKTETRHRLQNHTFLQKVIRMFNGLLSKSLRSRVCLLFLSTFMLTACGGGGGDTAPTNLVPTASGDTVSTNLAPTVSNVTITHANNDRTKVNDILTVNYTYADTEGDVEGVTTFRWLRDDQVISSATDRRYTLMIADAGANIAVEVTPVAVSGMTTGEPVMSAAITVKDSFSSALLSSITEADLSNVPDHQPFTFKQTPHQFINTRILPNGRIVGEGRLEASEISRLFSVTPSQAGFNVMTPNRVRGGAFSYPENTTIYLKNEQLFSIDDDVLRKISGNETVDDFWLSENEKKVFFIGNPSRSKIQDEATGELRFVKQDQLFMVDLATGTRVLLEENTPGSRIAYNKNNRSTHLIHGSIPRLLPDESRVVYVVINQISKQIELRSVNLDGTGKVVIDANMIVPTDGNRISEGGVPRIFMYAFSPDSSKIIYRVINVNEMELYSVTPDGSNKIKISAYIQEMNDSMRENSLLISQEKRTLNVTADSSRVLFLVRPSGSETTELHSARLDGRTKGSNLVIESNNEPVFGFALSLSSHSDRVIYSTANEVFSTSVSGGVPTQLSSGYNWKRVNELTLVDNDQSVIYAARDQVTNSLGLYLSKLNGVSTVNLSAASIDRRGVQSSSHLNSFILDPLGQHIVYRANSEQENDWGAMYKVKLDGTERIKITPNKLHTGRSQGEIVGFNNNEFYFIYEKNKENFEELFSFDVNNNTVTNISASWPEFITEDANGSSYFSSKGASTLTEAFTIMSTNRYDIHALQIITADSDCQILPPENTKILGSIMAPSGDLIYYRMGGVSGTGLFKSNTSICDSVAIGESSSETLRAMKLSPGGEYLVHTNNNQDLFLTTSDSTRPRLLRSSQPLLGRVRGNNRGAFAISPDSSHIIYWGRQSAVNFDLYSITRDGVTVNKINLPETRVASNSSFYFTPEISKNNRWVVYRAWQDAEGLQLYKSRLDGSDNTLLSDDKASSKPYPGYSRRAPSKITDDSSMVVYMARDNASNTASMHVASLEGEPSARQLTPIFSQGGTVNWYAPFLLTSDSLTVVYFARETTESPYEIFAARLDGSSVVKLNQPIVDGGRVINYRITVDNRQVVYWANGRDLDIIDLYVSNLDGSGKMQLQENILEQAYSARKPMLTDDGRAVFRAVINGVDGIYSKLLSGGVATLIFEVPEGRSINEILLTESNKLNIFGDLRQFGVVEKFSFDL